MIRTQAVTIFGSGLLVVIRSSGLPVRDEVPLHMQMHGPAQSPELPGFEDCRVAPERLP